MFFTFECFLHLVEVIMPFHIFWIFKIFLKDKKNMN